MANKFSVFLKKKILKKDQNLVSLDHPFAVMVQLLKGKEIKNVLDAGASNGRISRRLLKKFPSANAYAFEPNPLYGEKLKEYSQREPKFHPQFVALSDRSGKANLNITESAGNTSLLEPSERLRQIDPGAVVTKTQEVELVTIDEWARANGDLTIELMKFDIQGAELKALKGAVRTLEESTLVVYTEVWFNETYAGGAVLGEIDAFLREQGFMLYDIYGPKYSPKGVITWANAIFVQADKLGL